MRRAAILLLFAGLLAGCGKGSYSAGVSTTPSPSSGTTSRQAPAHEGLTRGRALAFARAVNLSAQDLPGFSRTNAPPAKGPLERRLEAQLHACVGAPGGARAALAELGSGDFTLRRGILFLTVSSEVSVSRTAAEATGALSAIRSPRVRGCFRSYLDQLLRSKRSSGTGVGPVSIRPGTPPAPGTSGGFAWRITTTLTLRSLAVPYYIDMLGFVYRSAQVTLLSSAALRPFPARAQERLYAELLYRARAHGL
jgi:hypothetical protein